MISRPIQKTYLRKAIKILLGGALYGGLVGAAGLGEPSRSFSAEGPPNLATASSPPIRTDGMGEKVAPSSPVADSSGPKVDEALAPPHPLDLPMDTAGSPTPVITVVALDRAGRLFATAGDDHLIRLWELPDGRLRQRLHGHRGWVRAAVFSPDGRYLATGGDDRKVMLFRVGEAEPAWQAEVNAAVYALAFSPDGQRLAAAGFSEKIWLFDSASGQQRAVWSAPGQDIRAVVFSPDGRQLATGGRNGMVRVWGAAEGTKLYDLPAHQRRIRTLAYSPDGRLLVSGGEDGQVILCHSAEGKEARVLAHIPAAVYAVAFCNQDRLAVGSTENRIRIFRITDGRLLRELTGHTGTVAALGWESSTQTLISGGFDTTVRFWQLGPGPSGPLAQRTPASNDVDPESVMAGRPSGVDSPSRQGEKREAESLFRLEFP